MKKQRGVTLIELMIAMVIVAILFAVAAPAYNSQQRKASRVDGQGFMLGLQAELERHFFDNDSYPNGFSAMAAYGTDTLTSPDGNYNVTMDAATVACPLTSCFVLTATAQGDQALDGDMTLASNGTRTPAEKW